MGFVKDSFAQDRKPELKADIFIVLDGNRMLIRVLFRAFIFGDFFLRGKCIGPAYCWKVIVNNKVWIPLQYLSMLQCWRERERKHVFFSKE